MFGHIDGIAVGEIFEDRKHLRASGIHAPMMAGIWGAQEGAYSIVLSGGYEDDIDELDSRSVFSYIEIAVSWVYFLCVGA